MNDLPDSACVGDAIKQEKSARKILAVREKSIKESTAQVRKLSL